MSKANDGGPAFARAAVPNLGGDVYCQREGAFSKAQAGMSLRAYVAARALQGLLSNGSVLASCAAKGSTIEETSKHLAGGACCYADALLRELGK